MDHLAVGIVAALEEAGGNVDKAILASWINNSCDPPALIQAIKTALVNKNPCYDTLLTEVIKDFHHTLERPCTEMPVAKRARTGF
jgi:hypothetical protein